MRADHFQNWRREREAIEQKMDCLIAEGLPPSIEERQVRRMRFAALIEQREAAARKLLELARTSRHDKPSKEEWVGGDRLISATPAGGAARSEDAKLALLPSERGIATAQVTIAASSSPVRAVSAGSDIVSAALDSADIADRSISRVVDAHPLDLARPTIDAVMSAGDRTILNSDDAPTPNSLPGYAVEPATGVAPHGTDAAASAAGPIAALTADATVALQVDVAHHPDAAALHAGSAAPPVAAPTADAAAASKVAIAHDPSAAALLTGSAAAPATGLPADATRPMGIVPHAPAAAMRSPDVAAFTATGHLADAAWITDVVAQVPDAATLTSGGASVTISGVSTKDVKPTRAVRYALSASAFPTGSVPARTNRAGALGRAGVVSHAPHSATFPRDAAEKAKPTEAIALAAAALPTHSTTIPADAAATSKAEIAPDPDAAALASDFAVMPDASPSAKIAKHSSDVSALNIAESAIGVPAESTEIPADIALLAHSVAIPAATIPDSLLPTVPDPLLPMDRSKTEDVHSDRSLLKLLQRLQSKLSRGGNETHDD